MRNNGRLERRKRRWMQSKNKYTFTSLLLATEKERRNQTIKQRCEQRKRTGKQRREEEQRKGQREEMLSRQNDAEIEAPRQKTDRPTKGSRSHSARTTHSMLKSKRSIVEMTAAATIKYSSLSRSAGARKASVMAMTV